MNAVPKAPFTTASAWKGADLKDRSDWLYRLKDPGILELKKALQVAKQTGKSPLHIEKDDSPLM